MSGKSVVIFAGVVCILSCFNLAHADWLHPDDSTFIFYPEDMTYVDRSDPLVNFGGNDFFKVRDFAYDDSGGSDYYERLHAARTYLKFSTDELQTALSGYTIDSASLYLNLTGVTDGTSPNTTEKINFRQVASADTYDYISPGGTSPTLTWDGQANVHISFGNVYASRVFSVSEAAGLKKWEVYQVPSGGGGAPVTVATLSELVEGWRSGTVNNYGAILEADFDGGWQEINSTKYTISTPTAMNELEAVFDKTTGNYPYIKLTVSQVVPEPTGGALTLLGFGVIALFRKMKKA